MKVAYFDCFSGAGGDMIVGALVDAGADKDELVRSLSGLVLDGYSLSIEPVTKQGFRSSRFLVGLESGKPAPHRHLSHILKIIEDSQLTAKAKARVEAIFRRLAEAEARVHGTTVEKVHFHEVGAVDAILDICGAVLALDLLGIDQVVCSPITTGSGVVKCEHGIMPVPAPATAELLKGVPVIGGPEDGELITPTAAAILTTLAQDYCSLPEMVIQDIGFGAGTREGQFRPNLLRVMIGEQRDSASSDEITVLETNIDDTSPQLVGYCLERLLEEGALDAYAMPIQMKKSRSGVLVTVLCKEEAAEKLEEILFSETRTFGVRRGRMQRRVLDRRFETVPTPYGDIRIKIGSLNGIVTATPEYEDCRSAAQMHGVAVRSVQDSANLEWQRSNGSS